MKTALLIIPQTNETVDRLLYLTDCIEEAIKEGFMPFSPDVYERFTTLSYDGYIERILPLVEAVFLFIDFGIDERMFNVILKGGNEKLIYKRKVPTDLNKYVNSLPRILQDVSERTKIPLEELQSKTRKREVVDARFIYYYRAKKCTTQSLRCIGLPVGADHATVLHGIKETIETKEVRDKYIECYGHQPIYVP
jgi:hypothetical protein